MIITCPSCQTRYKVDPASFGAKGRRVRCSNCDNMWTERPAEDLPKRVDAEAPPERDAPSEVLDAEAAAEDGAKGRGSAMGWGALGAVVIAVVAGAVLARESIVRWWPPAQRLYVAAGIPVPVGKAGLAVEVLSHDHAVQGGRIILIVKGKVTNISGEVRDVPKLRAWIRGKDASELANWTFAAGQSRLLPGETVPFVTRFQNPPAGAAALAIDFSGTEK
ncbi:MAG: zinc-ribbon domain-containing protein [Alphaproteobacteria bacterium]|nr:zinc-ribbon domain-containing protein [Alphaproteobacteria bacterium]